MRPTTKLAFPPASHTYNNVSWYDWANNPALLKAALRREEELRLCDAQQDLFAQVEHRGDLDWIDLADDLQERLVREFFGTTLTNAVDSEALLQNALGVLRTAWQRYPNDPDFRTIPLYVRYNRARMGTLRPGDRLPDNIALVHVEDGVTQDLHSAWFSQTECTKPLLIIASSWT